MITSKYSNLKLNISKIIKVNTEMTTKISKTAFHLLMMMCETTAHNTISKTVMQNDYLPFT